MAARAAPPAVPRKGTTVTLDSITAPRRAAVVPAKAAGRGAGRARAPPVPDRDASAALLGTLLAAASTAGGAEADARPQQVPSEKGTKPWPKGIIRVAAGDAGGAASAFAETTPVNEDVDPETWAVDPDLFSSASADLPPPPTFSMCAKTYPSVLHGRAGDVDRQSYTVGVSLF